jgi:ribosome-associated heat shock protein Hsp15
MAEKVRIDKWLWSVRIFKSRSISTDACKKGKVVIDEKQVKPSYLLQRGEIVHVKKDGFNYTFKVVDLVSKRVSASVAQPCDDIRTPEDDVKT